MTSVACIGMGYNHPAILEATKSQTFRRLLATRTGVGCAPPKEQRQLVQSAFLDVAPQGLDRVAGAMCGTCSIETAFKHAFICHAQKKRGGMDVEPSEEEMRSAMEHQSPGTPKTSILSFQSGFHGRAFGVLSATRAPIFQKWGFPAFDWPAAEPPRYRYPLADNFQYNRAQDETSLADVRAKISQWKTEKGSEVCAIVIEPVLSAGGDHQISAEFAQGL